MNNAYQVPEALRTVRLLSIRRLAVLRVLSVVLLILPDPLRAQRTIFRVKGSTPAVIAAVDDFKYRGADAVIVRRANLLPHDVILVKKAHAQARFLADAVYTLRVVRSGTGDVPTTDAVYRVRPRDKAGKRTEEAGGWANTLVSTRAMPLEGYGTVKQVILYLPNSARRNP